MLAGLIAYWLLFAAMFLIGGSFDINDPTVKRAQPWNWFMPILLCALVVGILLTAIAAYDY